MLCIFLRVIVEHSTPQNTRCGEHQGADIFTLIGASGVSIQYLGKDLLCLFVESVPQLT